MEEHQARYLEVRVRIPVQVQIFLLKFMKKKLNSWRNLNFYYRMNLNLIFILFFASIFK